MERECKHTNRKFVDDVIRRDRKLRNFCYSMLLLGLSLVLVWLLLLLAAMVMVVVVIVAAT